MTAFGMRFDAHSTSVYSIAFSPTGTVLASGDDAGVIYLWQPHSGRVLGTLQQDPANDRFGGIWQLAFNATGALLAAVGPEYDRVHLWDMRTRTDRVVGHGLEVTSVAFSPDRRLLAYGAEAVHVLDVVTGQALAELPGHTDWVTSVAFSPDGTLLASGSYEDPVVRVWEVQTMLPCFVLAGPETPVTSVVFSPDSRRLYASTWNATHRWILQTGEELAQLTTCGSQFPVALHPEGSLLALPDTNAIRLIDIATETERGTLHGDQPGAAMTCVAFSSDGRMLASGNQVKSVYVWEWEAVYNDRSQS